MSKSSAVVIDQVMVEETPDLIDAKLKEFRRLMDESNCMISRKDDDEYLLRFLRVAKFDTGKALDRIKKMEQWLDEKIRPDPEPLTAIRFRDFFTSGLIVPTLTTDKLGHLTLYFVYRLMDYSLYPPEVVVPGFFYYFERLLQTYGKEISGKGVSMVADCKGMGWKNFNLEMEKMFTDAMQGRWPIRFGIFAMAREPFILGAMMTLMKPFMSKKLKERIVVVGDKFDKLNEFFEPKDLPEELNGTLLLAGLDHSLVNQWIREESEELLLNLQLTADDQPGPHKLGCEIDPEDSLALRVMTVLDQSIGQRLGLKENDFLLKFCGHPVHLPTDLTIGDDASKIDCTVLRVTKSLNV